MQDPQLQQLIETAWRRPLTPPEQAQLRAHLAAQPQARAPWDEEVALTRALNQLPALPASSNFTARVLQAAARTPPRQNWVRHLNLYSWFPQGWMPRVALGAAMVCVSLLTIREYQDMQRKQMARDLASVSRLAALPPVDWLQNFDTIDRLNKVKVADEELLSVLQ